MAMNQKGVALLMVLWILMLLSVITGEFCYSMRVQANITRNFKDASGSYYIALAGMQHSITELVKWEVAPRAVEKLNETENGAASSVWRSNVEIPPVDFADGSYTVRIDNLGGRVNINRADERLLNRMLADSGLDELEMETIVDSILDWRDRDSFHRNNGAEDDYYKSLPEPYDCRNGSFESVYELLRVRGVSRELFYRRLVHVATVYPAKAYDMDKERKDDFAKYNFNRVNINAAPDVLLLLLPEMTEDLVSQIKQFRRQKDIASTSELRNILGPGVYKEVIRYVTFSDLPYYRIASTGQIKGSQAREIISVIVDVDTLYRSKYRIVHWQDGVDRRRYDLPEGAA